MNIKNAINSMFKVCCVCLMTLLYANVGKAQATKKDSSKTEFVAIQALPEFPGGMPAFSEFLSNNVIYPKQAFKDKIEGKVDVVFAVEIDGSLSDVKAVGNPNPLFIDEAIRVIKSSPKWTPGIQNDKPVRVQFLVPIVFSLKK